VTLLRVQSNELALRRIGYGHCLRQVGAAHSTQILIGIHGNGLTHELWLPLDSTLIEVGNLATQTCRIDCQPQIFPDGSFLKDYQTVAYALGHNYIALVRSK
jgi:hypothetical protein